MNTIDCIKSRRSVRKFTEEKVPHEVLEQLVELARWAPSWKNTQIARYVAVEDEALKNRIAEEATIPWNEGIIKGAPVLMVMTYVEKRCGYERDGSFSTSKGDRWQNFDCGIAAATFELAAHELGLGSVVLGIFEEEKLRELLELPEGMGVACLMPLGYPAEEPGAPKRKEVVELLTIKQKYLPCCQTAGEDFYFWPGGNTDREMAVKRKFPLDKPSATRYNNRAVP